MRQKCNQYLETCLRPSLNTRANGIATASNGRIRNEIPHEKERVIELSTMMALGRVQDAVKQAFRNVREEMIVRKATEPFENEIMMILMHDTFKVADELKRDLENL